MKYLQTLVLPLLLATSASAAPIPIGSNLELLADDHLIESLEGSAALEVHEPIPREVVFTADAPWEGNTSGFYTFFQDGKTYRMIYRGWQHNPVNKRVVREENACYAESADGIHWTRPSLGLVEFEGSTDNNIIWSGPPAHNFTAFRDDNPATPASARYKAIARTGKVTDKKRGLLAFKSPDCVHWKLIQPEPVITAGAFDSQNLAFWDAHRKEYRAYWRIFSDKVRAIRTATSKDLLTWENQADLTYAPGTPIQHLYTNAIQPYFRAPHLFIGFPTRHRPDSGHLTEPIFMFSRDGVHFTRYNDPVVPESAPKDRAGNRSNYMAWGMLQLPGQPDEISVYATEDYFGENPGRVRRFTYRLDGFVSLHASEKPGILLTKALTFDGDRLTLNAAVAEGGNLRVEIQDLAGKALATSTPFTGDSTAHEISWAAGADLSSFAGKPVRLEMHLENAHLYSFRFTPKRTNRTSK